MYRLVFPTKTVTLNCICAWHKEVSKLQAEGVNYYSYKRVSNGYEFLFN